METGHQHSTSWDEIFYNKKFTHSIEAQEEDEQLARTGELKRQRMVKVFLTCLVLVFIRGVLR